MASAALVVFRVSEPKWEPELSLGEAISAAGTGSGLRASGSFQKGRGEKKVKLRRTQREREPSLKIHVYSNQPVSETINFKIK